MKNAGASFQKFSPGFLVLTSILLCGLVCAPAGFAQTQPRTWAVIIGISKYPGLPGGQQLQFAERDAQSFAAALQSAGMSPNNIKLLVGAQANLTGIKEALGSWLAKSAGPMDTAIIYFSGHGFVEQSFGEAYLLAQDSNLQNVFATGLSLADVKHIVEARVRAGRVIILQDSIRKDMFDPDSDGPGLTETFFKAVGDIAASRANTSAIIASSPGEFSWEGRRWGEMGVFTKTLIEGMAGKADKNGDGSVTDVELFRFLSDQVPGETSGKQHPWRTTAPATEAVLTRSQAVGSRIATAARPATPHPATTAQPANQTDGQQRKPLAPASATGSSGGKAEGATAAPVAPSDRNAKLETEPSASPSQPSRSSSPRTRAPVESGPPQPSVGSRKTAPAKAQPMPPTVAATEPGEPASAPVGPVTGIGIREAPAPPRPAVLLPNPGSIAANPESSSRTGPVGPVPVETVGATPSPLVLQLELALDQGSVLSPAGTSAWDLYQRLSAVEPPAKELPQLKSRLIEALLVRSKAIVAGDVRSDNISSNVDDFRLAGQMLTRLHGFQPDNPDVGKLQKLSAAEALIALQFYDEAAKALEPLRTPAAGVVENALGLATLGQLSDYEAERHFKRAIELEPKWAAPHYNLALLYKNQKKDASLAELEQAARLDGSNPAILSALGDEYFERKQWNEAASAYREALRARPDDDALHTKLAHVLYSQGQRGEADKEYQKARDLASRRK